CRVNRASKLNHPPSMARSSSREYTTSKFLAQDERKMNTQTYFSQSSSAAQESRRIPRVRDAFAVTVVPLRGFFGEGRFAGEVREFHEEAACVKMARALAIGKRVKVRLRLPKSISYFYQGLPCEVSARVYSVRAVELPGERAFAVILRWEQPLSKAV